MEHPVHCSTDIHPGNVTHPRGRLSGLGALFQSVPADLEESVGAGEAVVDGADLVRRADDVAAVVPDEVRGRVLPGAKGGFERAEVFRVDDGIPGEAGVVEEAAAAGALARAAAGGRDGVVLVLPVPRRALVQERAVLGRPAVMLQDLGYNSIHLL